MTYIILCRRSIALPPPEQRELPEGLSLTNRAEEAQQIESLKSRMPPQLHAMLERQWTYESEEFLGEERATDVLSLSYQREDLKPLAYKIGCRLADATDGVLLSYVPVTSPARYQLSYKGQPHQAPTTIDLKKMIG